MGAHDFEDRTVFTRGDQNLPPLATPDSVLVSCPPCDGKGTIIDEETNLPEFCGYCAGTGLAVDDAVTRSMMKP